MTTALFPPPKVQFSDSNGAPLSGGSVYFYEPGTVTPKDTYSDYAGATANANPVVLDSRGEATIRLNGRYDVVVKDSAGSMIYTYSDVTASLDDLTATHSTGGADGTVSDYLDRHEGYDGVAALRALTPQNGKTYWLRYHTAEGDEGGGLFRGVSGAAASTYTEDYGFTILPTGGDGSAAFLRIATEVDPAYFGAQTSGDASTEIQRAINYWIAQIQSGTPSVLRIPREHSFATKLTFAFTSNITGGAVIDMRGGGLISTVATGNAIDMLCTAEVRNLDVYNWNVQASGTEDIVTLVDGGVSGSLQYFYAMRWWGPRIENAAAIGMKFTGNFFESKIDSPFLICTSLTAGTYALMLEDDGVNNPSSIDIVGGSLRGGINALYSNIGDCKVFGGTYIESGEHCINLLSSIAGGVSGAHVENAWKGGTGTDKAGIKITNHGYVRGVYCTSAVATSVMDTGVEVFSGPSGINVDEVFISGDTTKQLKVNSGSNKIRTNGIKRALTTIAATAEERLVSFRNNGVVKTNATATGTIALDVDDQDIYEGTATGNITFSAPTNPVAGDKLTIALKQDATGGRTVTWNAVFVVKTTFDPTASKQTTWTFYYTGGAWYETGAASQNKAIAVSDGTTGGTGSAGAGNQYIEIEVGGTTYKVLHDGTV